MGPNSTPPPPRRSNPVVVFALGIVVGALAAVTVMSGFICEPGQRGSAAPIVTAAPKADAPPARPCSIDNKHHGDGATGTGGNPSAVKVGATVTARPARHPDAGSACGTARPAFAVPPVNRVHFPRLALDLFVRNVERLRASGDHNASPVPPSGEPLVFTFVEVGSNKCYNAVQYMAKFAALRAEYAAKLKLAAASDLHIRAFFVDVWGTVENTYQSNEDGLADMARCKRKLKKYMAHAAPTSPTGGITATLIRNASTAVAADPAAFADAAVDFVYIDALHTYAGAASDIAAWWPKVKSHALFAGDDYGDEELAPVLKESHPPLAEVFASARWGVVRAVNEFATAHRLPLQLTAFEGHYDKALAGWPPALSAPNWFVIRPGQEPGCADYVGDRVARLRP